MEKNIQPELDTFFSDNEQPAVITLNRTKSPPGSNKIYALRREISEEAVKDLQIDLMPGFRLTWHYNEELVPDSLHSMRQTEILRYQRTQQFLRLFFKVKSFMT